MEEQKSISKSVVASISALAVAATVAGGGIAWFTIHNDRPQTNKPSTVTSPPAATVDPARVDPPKVTPMPIAPSSTAVVPNIPATPTLSTGTKTTKTTTPSIAQTNENNVKIWRLDDDGKKTFLVAQERKDPETTTSNPETRVQRSMSTLLASAGKPDGKLTSTIPIGTKLLSAKIQADGIHVDLSKEFTKGFGATSMIGRLGQVVYTATAQNPDAPVWITVEGKKLETLGDVGVEIRQPITRQTYDQDFPINPGTTTPENKS
jgi:spore germination protein GerM